MVEKFQFYVLEKEKGAFRVKKLANNDFINIPMN